MLQIRDVMTRHVFTVTPETTLREAADLFARHHISGAPVLAGHDVVGVVSATDLLQFVASHDGRRFEDDDMAAGADAQARDAFENEASTVFFVDREPRNDDEEAEPFHMDDAPHADLFTEHTVDEVMTRTICSLAPDAEVGEAAQVMWQAGIHRLLVLEDGQLSGILSMSDLARVLAAATSG
ncbi:MAG: CBS domain-containing protein [Gemmatimonadaceae bacterium]